VRGNKWLLGAQTVSNNLDVARLELTMNTNTSLNQPVLGPDRVLDVRPIPCSIKHGLIFRVWHELAVNDHFILLNDHDPIPLRYQFLAEFPEAFSWDYLDRGPEEFRVKITKTRPVADTSVVTGKAGSCGHHH
jgi:uncharacterized protein (DUF2249 family)